jgi:2-keto-4-pentenoate hydratase/2-oxohepta-3-ene-1,7-dioic acid hydratase in catechol pathway
VRGLTSLTPCCYISPSSLSGPNDPVVCDEQLTSKLDYEVELGFIIGKTVPRNIEAKDAHQYIGGKETRTALHG